MPNNFERPIFTNLIRNFDNVRYVPTCPMTVGWIASLPEDSQITLDQACVVIKELSLGL